MALQQSAKLLSSGPNPPVDSFDEEGQLRLPRTGLVNGNLRASDTRKAQSCPVLGSMPETGLPFERK